MRSGDAVAGRIYDDARDATGLLLVRMLIDAAGLRL
jgi:hypothetical protein